MVCFRTPGPLGPLHTLDELCDGTMARWISPLPGVLGLSNRDLVAQANAFPTDLTWDQIKIDMEEHESLVQHMYLDSVNKVTVGVGNMLPTLAAALNLGFVLRTTGVAATAEQVKADWDKVNAESGKNRRATSFAKLTALDLPTDICWTLLKKRIDGEFLPGVKRHFTDWDKFPVPAKRALLDMAYNLGINGLKKFKTLQGHVAKQSWAKAALSCTRSGIPRERNDWTRARFEEAAKSSPAVAATPTAASN